MMHSKKNRFLTLVLLMTFIAVQKANAQWQLLRLLARSSARSAVSSTVRSAAKSSLRITKPVRRIIRVVDAAGNISHREQIVQEEVNDKEETRVPDDVSDNRPKQKVEGFTNESDERFALDEIENISTRQESYNNYFLENEYRFDIQSGYAHINWTTQQEANFVACLCRKFRWSDGRVQRGRVAQYLNEAGFRINGYSPVERWNIPVYP
jgi:hypothetical protein